MKWEKHLDNFKAHLLSNTKVTSKNSVEKYLSCVLLMLRWIGKSDPRKITKKDIERYNAYMWDNYKQNSLVPHGVALNHFMNHLKKDIKISVPSKIKVEKTPLSPHEIEKILSCAREIDYFDYCLLLTVKDTIQREHAIRDLDIDDVRVVEKTIRFKSTKGGQPLVCNISSRTATALRDYIANHRMPLKGDSKALFVLPSTGIRLSKTALYDRVKKYAVMAGISKNVSPHLFRHSGISAMDKGGVSPSVGMKQSGHKDMKTYLSYCHPDRAHIRAEFDRTIGDGGGVEGSPPERTPYEREPIPETPPSNISNGLTDGVREELLMDALLTGRISEELYKELVAKLNNGTQKENLGYIG